MKHNVISIDLAKNVFQVCALDQHNRVSFNKKVTRPKLLSTLSQLQGEMVVMEACYSSNAWGRVLQAQGHQVKLIPPWQVKPFVVGNKTDRNDALAIAEAARRPKVRFVPVKTLGQQDLQSLDRIRARLIKTRTASGNQLRGLLSEYGLCVPRGLSTLLAQVPALLEDASNGLTATARYFVRELLEELHELERRLQRIAVQTAALLAGNEDYQRLQGIRGIGPVIAAALLAAVGDGKQFHNGRAMAAWLGLIPRLRSSGDKAVLGSITKRGNGSLRRLFIHGARAVVRHCYRHNDAFNRWVQQLLGRKHPCKAIVAVANKLARIAWVVLSKRTDFDSSLTSR